MSLWCENKTSITTIKKKKNIIDFFNNVNINSFIHHPCHTSSNVFADVATCAHVSNVHKSCNVIAENVLYAELQYRMLYRHAWDKGEYIYMRL